MLNKTEISIVLEALEETEQLSRERMLKIILQNQKIAKDFNVVTVIEDLKNMTDKQYEGLRIVRSRLDGCNSEFDIKESNIADAIDLLVLNSIIESVNCDILRDLSTMQMLSNTFPMILEEVKEEIIKYYNLDSKNNEDMELDLILQSKQGKIAFERNYKKLVKERSK